MNFKTTSCPNCGGAYNPAKYQCEYCGSYIFMSNSNYTDFSNVKIDHQRSRQIMNSSGENVIRNSFNKTGGYNGN